MGHDLGTVALYRTRPLNWRLPGRKKTMPCTNEWRRRSTMLSWTAQMAKGQSEPMKKERKDVVNEGL